MFGWWGMACVVRGVVEAVLFLFVRGGLPANSRLHPTEIAPLRRVGRVGLGVGAMLGG